MRSLRAAVGEHLPSPLTNRLRGAVRWIDQLAGLPFSGRRPGAICMYHVGRCGSSVLAEMLDQHPAIRWEREIYFHRWTRDGRRIRPGSSQAYLRRRMWSSGSRWYGFELKFLPQQHLSIVGLDLASYVAESRATGVTHNIVLRRRNSLRRMISAAAGVESGRRHAAAGRPAPAPERVRLRVDAFRLARRAAPLDLRACLDQIERSYAELAALLAGENSLALTFEEDIAASGPGRAYERVCAFLGITPVVARPHTQRLHPNSIESLLENYDEVATTLAGSPYAWMLRD